MKNIRRHPVDLFCLLLLLLLFALSAMLIAVLGSSVYRRILDRTDRTQDSRLVCAYLTQKIRQLNHVGGLSVETRDGVPVLSLSEEVNGAKYDTLLYCMDGELRELLYPEDGDAVSLSAGTEIMPLISLSFTILEESDADTQDRSSVQSSASDTSVASTQASASGSSGVSSRLSASGSGQYGILLVQAVTRYGDTETFTLSYLRSTEPENAVSEEGDTP